MLRRDGPTNSPKSTEAPPDNRCACNDQPQKDRQQYGGYEPFAEIEFLGIGHMTACSIEAGYAAGISWRSAWNCGEQADIAAFHHTRQRIQHPRHIPFRRALTLSFSAFND